MRSTTRGPTPQSRSPPVVRSQLGAMAVRQEATPAQEFYHGADHGARLSLMPPLPGGKRTPSLAVESEHRQLMQLNMKFVAPARARLVSIAAIADDDQAIRHPVPPGLTCR
jgi:hypothetical protein